MITLIGAVTIFLSLALIVMLRPQALMFLFAVATPYVAASIVVLPGSFSLQPAFFVAVMFIGVTMIGLVRAGRVSLPQKTRIYFGLIILFCCWAVASLFFPFILDLCNVRNIRLESPLFTTIAFAHVFHSSQLSQLIYLLFFWVTTLCMVLYIRNQETVKTLLRLLIYTGAFTCVWAIYMQFIHTVILGNEYPAWLFNNSKGFAQGYTQAIWVAGRPISRICSVAPEPSMFGFFLSLLSCTLFFLNLQKTYLIPPRMQKMFFWFFFITALMTTSSTAIIGMVLILLSAIAFGIIRFLKNPLRSWEYVGKTLVICVILIGLLVGLFYLLSSVLKIDLNAVYELYQNVSVNKLRNQDARGRTLLFFRGMDIFIDSGFLGTGWGSNRTTDFFSTMLANLGVVGMALFFLPVVLALVNAWKTYSSLLKAKNDSGAALIMAIISSVCIGFVLMMIAIPDLVFAYFWVFLAILFAVPQTFNPGSKALLQ